jgi:hypothetical protein
MHPARRIAVIIVALHNIHMAELPPTTSQR